MTQCCRNTVSALDRSKCANAGLLLARYLRVPVKEKESHAEERKKLFDDAINALKKSSGTYEQAFQRRKCWIETSSARTISGVFQTKGRIVIGLGGENILETGLTLERTYGTPLIPGCALKGLAAHYCSQIWGEHDPGYKINNPPKSSKQTGPFAKVLFGNTKEGGFITFHDAWFTPDSLGKHNSGLVHDVMTPHHGDYYSGDGSAPTDYDSPNPVLFLSITGKFHIALSSSDRTDIGKDWCDLAFQLLTEALENRGIGGKTSSGYGRMELVGKQESFEGNGESPVSSETFARTVEVVMTGINKKGNQQLRTKTEGIRCTIREEDVIKPQMQKGEIRTFWLFEERPGNEYVITTRKPE